MLGSGRPFLIEVINPHRVRFSPEEFQKMEQEINAITPKVQVHQLQRVGKSDVLLLKDAEENKKKTYRCCVWIEKPILESDLEFLKEIKDLKIEQKTPVRVLHRRALATRVRLIHSIKGEYINPHFLFLDLVTQAGTYVKEFIHSDFGRTMPNFGSMLNTTADILQLDVMNIDVQYPLSHTKGIKSEILQKKHEKKFFEKKKAEAMANSRY